METMEAILELRKKLNISQDEFARKLSVTRQAVPAGKTETQFLI